MKVILISGRAQHGKDTLANFLKNALETNNKSVLIVHYADLLKYICRVFFDWDGNKDEHGRTLLQYVGTDVIRKQNENYWVNFIGQMLLFFNEAWDYVLIPDCRFPNEIDCLREMGLDVSHIRVIRKDFISSLTKEQQVHSSETALDNIEPDYYISNDGSLSDLQITAIQWVASNVNERS